MEPRTPEVREPDGVNISWKDERPYVEIWHNGHLVLAGWVYDEPTYVLISGGGGPISGGGGPTYVLTSGGGGAQSPFGPVQAGIVASGVGGNRLSLVSEPVEPYHGKVPEQSCLPEPLENANSGKDFGYFGEPNPWSE
jgi:hypothetical protein